MNQNQHVVEERDHKKGKISLFLVFDSSFTFFTTNLHPKNFYRMSNPVVFFDMEIGGQPAGRIEMTVRIYCFCSLLRVFPSSRAR